MYLQVDGDELLLGYDHMEYSRGIEADPEIACNGPVDLKENVTRWHDCALQ